MRRIVDTVRTLISKLAARGGCNHRDDVDAPPVPRDEGSAPTLPPISTSSRGAGHRDDVTNPAASPVTGARALALTMNKRELEAELRRRGASHRDARKTVAVAARLLEPAPEQPRQKGSAPWHKTKTPSPR